MRMLFFLIVVFSTLSCTRNNSIPQGIIQPEKMEVILWDCLKADAYCSELLKKESLINDTLENVRLKKIIFKKHQITNKDFNKSYSYYRAHPDLMVVVIDSIIAQQNRDKVKAVDKRKQFDISL